MLAADNYSMVRQFPDALKLYDRALDITRNVHAVARVFLALWLLASARKLAAFWYPTRHQTIKDRVKRSLTRKPSNPSMEARSHFY